MAIAVQAVIAVILIAIVGTSTGQTCFDTILTRIGLDPIPWAKFNGGFETLVVGSAPLFWLLTLLTTVSLFVLRYPRSISCSPIQGADVSCSRTSVWWYVHLHALRQPRLRAVAFSDWLHSNRIGHRRLVRDAVEPP